MTEPPGKRDGSGKAAPLQTAADQDRKNPNRRSRREFESEMPPGEAAALEEIKRAVSAGEQAPTTDTFVEILGCESYSTPTVVLRRLQLRGLIRVESFQKGRRIWLADGRSTVPVSCTEPPWRWRDRPRGNGRG